MARRRPMSLVPAAAFDRPETPLTPEEADLSAAAIDAFAVAIGGRETLMRTLAIGDGTREIQKVARWLIDPSYATWSLRRICTTAGLTVADLFTAYRKALLIRAHLEATKIVADQLVAVVQDIMARSQPYEIPCASCQGEGTVASSPTEEIPDPPPKTCEACRGRGTLLVWPELDRQKVALELGHLLQRTGGGINILNAQVAGSVAAAGGGAGTFEQLQQAVQATLASRPLGAGAVEGEVLPEAGPTPAGTD